jgi:hypothetical protein
VRYWDIIIKTRHPGGGWWNKPIGPSFDPVEAFGPPDNTRGAELWYSTGDGQIFITAELKEINHGPDLDHPVQHP